MLSIRDFLISGGRLRNRRFQSLQEKAHGTLVLILFSLLGVMLTFQNCAPTFPPEETFDSSSTKSSSTTPSVSDLVGDEPLPVVPSYTNSSSTAKSTDLRVCQIFYASGVEKAYNGQPVSKEECVARYTNFTSDPNFDQFQITCSFGTDLCGSRAPVTQEQMNACVIRYGDQAEQAYQGATVPKSFCMARYNQFLSNAAFNSLELSCIWNNQSCGSRPAIQVVPQEKCTINYGGNVEQSFGGLSVSRDLCVARYNQFINEAAFSAYKLMCTWNGTSCGARDPVATEAAPPPEPLSSCIVNYDGNIERSFNGQMVTLSLCKERFQQFVSNSAFDALSLTCSFGAETCGLREPVFGTPVSGPCVITYAGNTERAFDGQAVTKSMCQARFNQFVVNPAFNPYQLSCRFNETAICGERGPNQ